MDCVDPTGEMGILRRTIFGGALGTVIGGTGGMVASGVKIPKAVANAANFLVGTIGSHQIRMEDGLQVNHLHLL